MTTKDKLSIGAILLCTLLALCISFMVISKPCYYYNAYAPGYDEYFVIKSYSPMPLDTIVHFDDKATVTDQKTGYTAKILSIY